MHTFRLKKVFDKVFANVRIWSSKLCISVKIIPLEEIYACKVLHFLLSSSLTLFKNSFSVWFLDLWHTISGNPDLLGEIGLQETSYQNDKLFFFGFEKKLKLQASVLLPGSKKVRKSYSGFKFALWRNLLDIAVANR